MGPWSLSLSHAPAPAPTSSSSAKPVSTASKTILESSQFSVLHHLTWPQGPNCHYLSPGYQQSPRNWFPRSHACHPPVCARYSGHVSSCHSTAQKHNLAATSLRGLGDPPICPILPATFQASFTSGPLHVLFARPGTQKAQEVSLLHLAAPPTTTTHFPLSVCLLRFFHPDH